MNIYEKTQKALIKMRDVYCETCSEEHGKRIRCASDCFREETITTRNGYETVYCEGSDYVASLEPQIWRGQKGFVELNIARSKELAERKIAALGAKTS